MRPDVDPCPLEHGHSTDEVRLTEVGLAAFADPGRSYRRGGLSR